MSRKHKLTVLIFTGIAVLAMFLLGIGLSGQELLPGDLSFFNFNPITSGAVGGSMPGDWLLTVLKILYFAGWILIPVVAILLIISKDARKRFIKMILQTLPFILIVFLFLRFLQSMNPNAGSGQTAGSGYPGQLSRTNSLQVPDFISHPSQFLILFASIAIAIVTVAMVASALWFFWLRPRQKEPNPLLQLAQEAQTALDSLHSGGDFKNTIIRCYIEMNRAVNEMRGISRDQAMTPQEFQAYLEKSGIPGDPVRQLTHLFEEARYGTLIPRKVDELRAIDSLTAIVDACRSSA